MKNFRGFALGLVLGLATAIAGVGFAQNAGQTDASKKAESCCCSSESCSKDGSKNQSDKHACCCCGGDSCNMMDMKNMKMKTKP